MAWEKTKFNIRQSTTQAVGLRAVEPWFTNEVTELAKKGTHLLKLNPTEQLAKTTEERALGKIISRIEGRSI